MKATVRLERPDEVEATITMSMPLSEWKGLLKDLRSGKVLSGAGKQLHDTVAELVARTQQEILGEGLPVRAATKAEPEGKELPDIEILSVKMGDKLPPEAYQTPVPRRRAPGAQA